MRPATEALKILERRKSVLDMWMRGCLQWQIARDLDISRRTVCRDLEAIMAATRERLVDRMESYLWEEIGKLNRWEWEANEAWDRSKLDAQIRTAKVVKAADERAADGAIIPGLAERSETSRRDEGQCGDPRYLTTALACARQRCELLSLFVNKIAQTDAEGKSQYSTLEAIVAELGKEEARQREANRSSS